MAERMEESKFQILGLCASDGETDLVLSEVDKDPELITRALEDTGGTLLYAAVMGERVDLARELLDRKANIHQQDKVWGLDALMCAAIYNSDVALLELLLTRGADMGARNKDGNTALALAAWNCQFAACKYLISKGSNLMATNNEGKTALDIYGLGDRLSLSPKECEQIRAELRAAFASV